MRTYYDVLGVKKSASTEEIRSAYKKLVLQLHPDKNPSANVDEFNNVADAYKILSDQQERKKYDRDLAELIYDVCISPFSRFHVSGYFHGSRTYFPDDLNVWRKKMSENFSSEGVLAQDYFIKPGELENNCVNLKYFFLTFEGDLTVLIDESKEEICRILPIFVSWIAMKDDVEILMNKNFIHIFNETYPFNKLFEDGSPIAFATAFQSKNFIHEGFRLGLFNLSDVREALSVATAMNDDDMMSFISQTAAKFGIDVSTINDDANYNEDYDPLPWAIISGHEYGVKLLLAHNIKMDSHESHDILKQTYLHIAIGIEDKNINIIRLIFENTANLNHKNFEDETPFDLAKKSGSEDIINLFKKSDKNLDRNYTPGLFQPVLLSEIFHKTEDQLFALTQ